MRLSARLLAVLVAAFCLLPGLPSPAAASTGTVVSGTILTQDTTWTPDNSPYLVSAAVQIPAGVTLTIEPGTVVQGTGAGSLLRVLGTVRAVGTTDQPIVLDGGGSANIVDAKNSTAQTYVDIEHAVVRNAASFWPATGYAQYGHFDLRDSQVSRVTSYSYIWYPGADVHIERNTFVTSGGFSIGHDTSAVYITDNRFNSASTTGYWVRNWAAYHQPTQVHGNTFQAAGSPAVEVEQGYSSARLDATGNYWGTTDPSVINAMVADSSDSIDYASAIPVDPVLAAPTDTTPAGAPSAPANTELAFNGASAVVTWTPPAQDGGSPITGYTVTVIPGRSVIHVGAATTEVEVPGMVHGTFYGFEIRAQNAVGEGDFVLAGPSTPAATPSVVPYVSAVATAAAGEVTVYWGTPADDGGASITGYTVDSSCGGGPWPVAAPSTQVTLTAAGRGRACVFSVAAENAVGAGPAGFSDPVNVPDLPAAPSDLVVTAAVGSLHVSWTAADTGGATVTNWLVTVEPGDLTVPVTAFGPSSTDITNLANGTTYTVSVAAQNSIGVGPTAVSGPARTPDKPSAPSAVTASPGQHSLHVTWTPGGDGGSPVTGWRITASPGDLTLTEPAAGRSADLTGLTPGTSYTVAVQALNAVGLGAAATAAPAQPIDTLAPAAPHSLTVTGSPGAAVLTWANPTDSDLAGVVVVEKEGTRSPAMVGDGTPVYRGTGSSATVHGLLAGKDYSFAVFAYDRYGNDSPGTVAHLAGTLLRLQSNATTLTYGAKTQLTATLARTSSTAKPAGAAVQFYARNKGTTAWTYLGTAHTNTAGTATWTTPPAHNSEYTARFNGSPGLLGAASGNNSVTVRAAVTATLTSTTIHKGGSTQMIGRVSPSHAGKKVQLQQYRSGRWTTLAATTLTASSTYRFTIKAAAAGTTTYRVLFAGDNGHAAGVSPARHLTVK